MKNAYLNSTYDHVINTSGLSKEELYWFEFESELYQDMDGLEVTHYSYYEPWDPYRNYQIAKKYCGLKERKKSKLNHSLESLRLQNSFFSSFQLDKNLFQKLLRS